MKCILCGGESAEFFKDSKTLYAYFHCATCDLRFLDPSRRLTAQAERERYRNHQNDVQDPRYQEFMRPIIDMIRARPAADTKVLDFGCGAGPVFRHVLEPEGYSVSLYDPFFYPERVALESTYDFIAAVEVLEHLYDPGNELELLRALLKPCGRLGLMTLLFSGETDFASWYYRRDPTHVGFYSRKTMGWIQAHFAFSHFTVHTDRVIELEV